MKDGSRAQHIDARISRASATFLAALEGQEAAREGQPISANPYEPGTLDRLQWLSGWMKSASSTRTSDNP